jgi:hypothetical protein
MSSAAQRTSSPPQGQQQEYEDFLTVFQAAPLAYLDESKVPQPFQRLDFNYEREILLSAFKETGAKIAIRFETATTDRLSAFLAKGEGRILHFSCHGKPGYLVLDDGWGAPQALEVSTLKEWISHGGQSLRFVFVSACHSNSVGQAFVDAGVPHVVCCSHDSNLLRADAAIEFEKAFYRALASGRFLREAFELARQEIMAYSSEMRDEVGKYCLLPRYKNHDVPIFFREPYLPKSPICQPNPLASSSIFPPAPEDFVGRDVEMFRIIQAVKDSRLIRVSGPTGIGKSALVKACCRYLSDRLPIVNLQEILWAPFDRDFQTDCIISWFEDLFDAIHDDESPVGNFRLDCFGCLKKIIEFFKDKRSLLVVEAKNLTKQGMTKLTIFLEDLLWKSTHVKVIVIHRDGAGEEFASRRMPCVEADVEVGTLDVSSTVKLFGRMCQHVTDRKCAWIGNYKELHNLLIRGQCDGRLSQRLSSIFDMLGAGIPDKIHRIARKMSTQRYSKLIAIGRQNEVNLKFDSRASILKKEEELRQEIDVATMACDFLRCHELQGIIDEIEALQKSFPDLHTLKQTLKNVSYERDKAISAKDWVRAGELQAEMDLIQTNIQVEKDALIAFGIIETQQDHAEIFATRSLLEAKIAELKLELQEASENNYYQSARRIDRKLQRLEELKPLRPSKAELASKVSQLEKELDVAKKNRDWETAEKIFDRLQEVKDKLELEKQAEETLGTSAADGEQQLRPEEAAAAPLPQEISEDSADFSHTRAYIDARIRELESDLEEAADRNDFQKAREAHTELLQLEEMKFDRPSKGGLCNKVLQLDNELSSAKRSRDWDAAEGVFQRLKEATAKLESEQKAEEVFGTSDEQLPDLVEGPDPRAGQNQISGLTRSNGTFVSGMPGDASGSLDGKIRSGPSESAEDRPGAFSIDGPGNTFEAAATNSDNDFLPVARRVSDRESSEQQKNATKHLVQDKKEKMWIRIRREVLLEELKNLHAFNYTKGLSLQHYLRSKPQSEEPRVDGESQRAVSVASQDSGDSTVASEAEDTKPSALSPDEAENGHKPDITIPALYTDNDLEKKKEGDGSFMKGAVFLSDSPFFQSTDLRPPELNLESEADGHKEKRRGPKQKLQFFKSDIFSCPLGDKITIESHQAQSDEQEFPVPSRETPTIAEESLDAMSHSTTRADNVERREIDEEILEYPATEEDDMDEPQTIQQPAVSGAASVGTSRDDYSQIEEMVHQVIRDMNVPAATVVRANLPDQATPGRRIRLFGNLV